MEKMSKIKRERKSSMFDKFFSLELDVNGNHYGYVRVSTSHQDTDVQEYEIKKAMENYGAEPSSIVKEKISGVTPVKQRKIYKLIKKCKKGDVIWCTEVSRLGRTMEGIFEIISMCIDRGVVIRTLKEGFTLRNNVITKIILAIFAYVAECERILICERTREGLDKLKREGKTLGRPAGSKNKKGYKLDEKKKKIISMLNNGVPKTQIAKKMKVHPSTLYDWLKRNDLF